MSSSTPDYAELAERYDELRPVGPSVLEGLDRIVREGDFAGRRVVDVGCGTGRLAKVFAERYGAKVWGVDPTQAMLDVARRNVPRGVGLKLGRAENLPFRDGWFERALMSLVVHVVERPAAFAEVRRILGQDGRLVISTPDPAHFADHWLARFLPSYVEVEEARFPSAEVLEPELVAAGFESVRVVRLERREFTLDREFALRKFRGRYGSTFQLIDEAELDAGLARAERELPDVVRYHSGWLIVVASR